MDAAVVRVRSEHDAAEASRLARTMALEVGLASSAAVRLATAVSEIAMNQVRHAVGGGVVRIAALEGEAGPGVSVEARDEGPGIEDVERALQDGFSTRGSLGLGLSGARRLVDEFRLSSDPGGTCVSLVKWGLATAPDPDRLAAWAIAGPADDATPVVESFAGGLLVAVVDPAIAPSLRGDPERAVGAFLDSGGEGAVAVLAARDGAISWARRGRADAVRLRGHGRVAVAGAPLGRGETCRVFRGDWVVLSSRGLADAGQALHAVAGGGPGRVAAGAAVLQEADGTAIAAEILRGALERPARA